MLFRNVCVTERHLRNRCRHLQRARDTQSSCQIGLLSTADVLRGEVGCWRNHCLGATGTHTGAHTYRAASFLRDFWKGSGSYVLPRLRDCCWQRGLWNLRPHSPNSSLPEQTVNLLKGQHGMARCCPSPMALGKYSKC